MKLKIQSLLLLASLALPAAQAAVIGYWRFEGANFEADSSGNNNNLSAVGSPSQTTLPLAGAGSAFPDPIPQPLASNGSAASFNGISALTASDIPAYAVGNQMTIEFFFNSSVIETAADMIASQFNSIDGQRSWFIAVIDTGSGNNQLRFSSSVNGNGGGSLTTQNSTFANGLLLAERDYYGAAVYNAGEVTFYLQDLTGGGALTSSTVGGFQTSLHNTTADLRIGAFGSSTTNIGNPFNGLIDEVRFSNTALSSSELLAVPEPGTAGMVGLVMLGALALGRRRPRI